MIEGTPVDAARMLGSHYLLGDLIGRGAMGEVHVAIDTTTGERVAAKLLRADHSDDDEVTARFLQERRLLRDLVHPNIVRVHELVVERDAMAIVMDLIDGADLRKRLRDIGRFQPAEAVRICVDVLSALELAHSLNPPVQHRDVKPDNVMLDSRGRVYLTDFGVARLAEVGPAARLTSGIGTADYMAPEMTGETAGVEADVYAVGVMLYELLAGHTPFGGDSFRAVALRHVTSVPPPLADAPIPLWDVIAAMLDKNPDRRPVAAEAAQWLRALEPDLLGLDPLPATDPPREWQQVEGLVPGVWPRGAAEESALQTSLRGSEDSQLRLSTHLRGSAPIGAPAAAEPGSRSRRKLLAIAGVGVVVLAAVVAVVLSADGDSDKKPAASGQLPAAPSAVKDAPNALQNLQITRSASWNTATTATVITTFTSVGGTDLSSSALLDVCPMVTSIMVGSCGLTGTPDLNIAGMAYFVTGPTAGGSVSVKSTVTVQGADPAARTGALEYYLSQASVALSAALRGIGPNDGKDYLLQRIAGIELNRTDSVASRYAEFPVYLTPLNASDQPINVKIWTSDNGYNDQSYPQLGRPTLTFRADCPSTTTNITPPPAIAPTSLGNCNVTSTLGPLSSQPLQIRVTP